MTISMRQEAANIGVTDLSGGFLNAVLNPFWLASPDNLGLFPFRNADGISFQRMIQAWKWPSGWTVSAHPNNSDNANYANLYQGISCDGNAWFITAGGPPKDWGIDSPPRLWRRDLSTDLDTHSSITIAGIHYVGNPSSMSDSYVHFGDCCVIWANGGSYVVVPVEYKDKDNHLLAWKIHVPTSNLDPYMTFFDAAPLELDPDDGVGGAWFGVMPSTTLGFCSNFYNDAISATVVHVYSYSFTSSSMFLDGRGDFHLYNEDGTPFTQHRFQGGAVSPAGHLYIACDQKAVDGGGVYGFDLITGRKRAFLSIGDGGAGGALKYEIEGLCVFNTNGVPGASGQIHVGKIQLDVIDNLTIYHFKTSLGEEGLV